MSNKEDLSQTISDATPLSCHFHISEPNLAPIGLGNTNHNLVAKKLKDILWDKWVSIEMPLPASTAHTEKIENALTFVTPIYG